LFTSLLVWCASLLLVNDLACFQASTATQAPDFSKSALQVTMSRVQAAALTAAGDRVPDPTAQVALAAAARKDKKEKKERLASGAKADSSSIDCEGGWKIEHRLRGESDAKKRPEVQTVDSPKRKIASNLKARENSRLHILMFGKAGFAL
jgi:hypothetical protein